jgi:hypothetical protein
LIERKREGAQHILTSGQIPLARGDLAPEELPHLGDLIADGFQRARPARIDQVGEGACGHDKST